MPLRQPRRLVRSRRTLLSIGLASYVLAFATVPNPPATALATAGSAVSDGPRPAVGPSCASSHWITNWLAVPTDATLEKPPIEQTYRIQVRPLHRGSVARFKLSNLFGVRSVTFGAVTLGVQARAGSPAIKAGTLVPLTFGGRRSISIPAGREVYTDPVRYDVRTFRRLLVSIHVVGLPGPATQHGLAEQTTWETAPLSGDHTDDLSGSGFVGLPLAGLTPAIPQAIPYLSGMQVRAPRKIGTVVTFGDSITDGAQSSIAPALMSPANIDRFASYPDQLAERLKAADLPFSVANAGLSGNQLLTTGPLPIFGPSGLSRLRRDALTTPGVSTLIVLIGINDIGLSSATKESLVEGYRHVIAAAHARGLRVLLGTITPQNGTLQPGYGASAEPTRLAVNHWIRRQRLSDGVVDFDRAVRDPESPDRIRPEYDGGDHLHFSAAGYQAMAAAVPLRQLATPRCVSHGRRTSPSVARSIAMKVRS